MGKTPAKTAFPDKLAQCLNQDLQDLNDFQDLKSDYNRFNK
jgi:hypothetical protein